jgi:predicted HTH domain antitoxin
MPITIDIPDSVLAAMRLPRPRLPGELLLELAVALYSDEILSFGKARELAGVSVYEFSRALGIRKIVRHYGDSELADDIAYARGQ